MTIFDHGYVFKNKDNPKGWYLVRSVSTNLFCLQKFYQAAIYFNTAMNYNNKIICKNHLKPLPLQTMHQSFRRLTNQDIDSFWAFKTTRYYSEKFLAQKGRLRTLSSTFESRKFKLGEDKATKRPC